ncbi:MAG TPA: hypothetical protein DD640_06805 [Clostridiales bacterium]|nr:hypothetical protein [Clostridiales bacterium]
MIDLMSKPTAVNYTPHIALSAQWKVEADPAYKVVRAPQSEDFQIAVRTLSGQGQIRLRDQSDYLLEQNSLLLISRNQIARYFCSGNTWKFHWFEFQSSLPLAPYQNQLHTMEISAEEFRNINDCFAILGLNTAYSSLRASSIFAVLLTYWLDRIHSPQNADQSRLESLIGNTLQDLSVQHTVRELARLSQMSERSFRDKFSRYTGFSPKQYLEKRKLDSALDLLATTHLPIKEIAGMLGFADPYYFSRFIARQAGLSPEAFRRKANPVQPSGDPAARIDVT